MSMLQICNLIASSVAQYGRVMMLYTEGMCLVELTFKLRSQRTNWTEPVTPEIGHAQSCVALRHVGLLCTDRLRQRTRSRSSEHVQSGHSRGTVCSEWSSRTAVTIRYDTRCYFNVRSKVDISQLNLLHGTNNNKSVKQKTCSEVK